MIKLKWVDKKEDELKFGVNVADSIRISVLGFSRKSKPKKTKKNKK